MTKSSISLESGTPHQHFFLQGGGRLGQLMRQHSWTDTLLGHPDLWPSALRHSVTLCLQSNFPLCIYWGPELCLLYNDAAAFLTGANHPSILGRSSREFWQRTSSEMATTLQEVLLGGVSTQIEDQYLSLNRRGYEEECYFTHTSSPILSEDGQVSGVLHGLFETTARVLAKRRGHVLNRLAEVFSSVSGSEQFAHKAVHELAACRQDVPFVAFYRRGQLPGEPFEQISVEGYRLSKAAKAAFLPPSLPCGREGDPHLPAYAQRTSQPENLPDRACFYMLHPSGASPLPEHSWGLPVRQLVVMPLVGAEAGDPPMAYLLLGINPRLRVDAEYGSFLRSIALLTGSALHNLLDREQRAERAEVHRLALATGSFGTWSFDPDLDEFELSERAAELFGYQGALHRCRLSWAVQRYHPEDRITVLAAFRVALEKGTELCYEARILLPDGTERWLWMRGSFYTAGTGSSCLVGLVGDITDRHRAEELLQETEKLAAAGSLAATVAQEINNPLESATNLIYLAMLDDHLSPSTRQLLHTADSELNRVTHSAQQTFWFYRDTLVPVRVDIRKVLEDTAQLLERHPELNKATLDLSRVQTATLFCLQGELRQVLFNLLANAIQASHIGSRVLVTARISEHWKLGDSVIRISITDSGNGIDPAIRHQLFQPFFTTKRDSGRGLGLWVSKNIIEKQNGTIRWRSRTGERSGTCFMITLPVQGRRSMVH